MSSQRESFYHSGPTHSDWNNQQFRRSVAACLVERVYMLELARQSQCSQVHAAPLWLDFHFILTKHLFDCHDKSIIGAVYAYNFSSPQSTPPAYVIAFRGNLIKLDTMFQDFKLDFSFLLNILEQRSRFQEAWKAVQEMVDLSEANKPVNIWLAGHSLGAAIALLAGRNMFKKGYDLETYLFNPPFPSLPIESSNNEKVGNAFHNTNKFITAGFVLVRGHQRTDQTNLFTALFEWVPNIYVNPSDPICSGYIEYFKDRDKKTGKCLKKIQNLALQNSKIQNLPSANVHINRTPSGDFKQNHGIQQWWEPDLVLESRLHKWRT
ncbi:unnamed protein product [Ilex paraguariensis]|uniref:Fungal lipase-type domain-containing protein n=1 Tax=Ilex paraguariensis TaxID=185542 RepID=A0ABC8RN16_9AQUA